MTSTFYALPEGSRGIFVGGGGAVRIPRLIGVARMTDMMLTGRVYNAADGERIGLAQYLVPAGGAFDKALGAGQTHCRKRPADQLRPDARPAPHCRAAGRPGLHDRSHDGRHCPKRARSQERVRAFLEGRAAKVQKA
jgi:enoyl-CoA hydratase/carnithine racemase